MSSPNRSTSDIEDTFFSMNILNYISVSSDYFSTSAGSRSFNSSENSTMIPSNQTCDLVSPSFSVYTSTPPQVFEIGKYSDKRYLKHHEKQVKDILNYLDELHLHRIEKMEEGCINGNPYSDYNTSKEAVRAKG
ncbi:hypothetical protein Tco_1366957 [Tanacetum coccineum]